MPPALSWFGAVPAQAFLPSLAYLLVQWPVRVLILVLLPSYCFVVLDKVPSLGLSTLLRIVRITFLDRQVCNKEVHTEHPAL